MPFVKKVVNPLDELPPYRALLEVIAALETHDKSDLAKLALKRLRAAEELYRKELLHLVKAQEQSAQEKASKPAPKLDLKGMEKAVSDGVRMVETLFSKLGQADVVTQVHKDHAGPVDVAGALLDAARHIDDETVSAVAGMLRKDLERFRKAKERVAQGGHAVFEDDTVKHATSIWRSLDAGYAILSILVLDEGRIYDAVLANQPITKTALRPVLSRKDPSLPSAKPAKGTKKGGKGKKADAGSSNGASATGTDGGGPTK